MAWRGTPTASAAVAVHELPTGIVVRPVVAKQRSALGAMKSVVEPVVGSPVGFVSKTRVDAAVRIQVSPVVGSHICLVERTQICFVAKTQVCSVAEIQVCPVAQIQICLSETQVYPVA